MTFNLRHQLALYFVDALQCIVNVLLLRILGLFALLGSEVLHRKLNAFKFGFHLALAFSKALLAVLNLALQARAQILKLVIILASRKITLFHVFKVALNLVNQNVELAKFETLVADLTG